MGHGAIVGGIFDGLGNTFGSHGRYVDAVAAIVLGGCANVPAADVVTGPGAADGRSFMDKYLNAGWYKGQETEIVGDVELGFDGKAWVDAGQPEKIECGCRLGN